MKVLHVIPSVSERSGGPGQAIFQMCCALQEQGIDITLATTDAELTEETGPTTSDAGFNPRGSPQCATRNSYKGVPTLIFPAQLGNSFKYSRPLAVWLNANVKNFDLVHIHAVFNHACIAAARACRKHGVPYIVRPLGTLDPWSMKQKSLKKLLFWQVAAKQMMRGAAAVHYTAKAEKEATEESLGLNHGRVVPLGIDAKILVAPLNYEGFAANFPELLMHPYVLVLSRLHPKKGLDILLDAFLSLVKQPEFAEWRLVLAGEGPVGFVSRLKEKVSVENASAVVFFPGWLQGKLKNAVLRHSCLLALPSYQENFGLCLMEAMACGIPVLVSPHVNLAPEIEAAGAGWISTVDKGAITAALAEALGNDAERSSRGRAGKTLSMNFTWDKVAGNLKTLYSSIASDRDLRE